MCSSDNDLPDDTTVAGVGGRVAGLKGFIEADLRFVVGARGNLRDSWVIVLQVWVRHTTHITIWG